MRHRKEYRHPWRRWMERQPPEVTQKTIAKELGVDRSYVCELMSDNTTITPSLTLGMKIEKMTRGQVKVQELFNFALANRARAEEAA